MQTRRKGGWVTLSIGCDPEVRDLAVECEEWLGMPVSGVLLEDGSGISIQVPISLRAQAEKFFSDQGFMVRDSGIMFRVSNQPGTTDAVVDIFQALGMPIELTIDCELISFRAPRTRRSSVRNMLRSSEIRIEAEQSS